MPIHRYVQVVSGVIVVKHKVVPEAVFKIVEARWGNCTLKHSRACSVDRSNGIVGAVRSAQVVEYAKSPASTCVILGYYIVPRIGNGHVLWMAYPDLNRYVAARIANVVQGCI